MKGSKQQRAGRPALPEGVKKVGAMFKLTPALIRWLRLQPRSQGVVIEEALREKYGDEIE